MQLFWWIDLNVKMSENNSCKQLALCTMVWSEKNNQRAQEFSLLELFLCPKEILCHTNRRNPVRILVAPDLPAIGIVKSMQNWQRDPMNATEEILWQRNAMALLGERSVGSIWMNIPTVRSADKEEEGLLQRSFITSTRWVKGGPMMKKTSWLCAHHATQNSTLNVETGGKTVGNYILFNG